MRKKTLFFYGLTFIVSILAFFVFYYIVSDVPTNLPQDDANATTCETNSLIVTTLDSTATTKLETSNLTKISYEFSTSSLIPTTKILTNLTETIAVTTLTSTATTTTTATITTTPITTAEVPATIVSSVYNVFEAKTIICTAASTLVNTVLNNAIIFNEDCIYPVTICDLTQENVDMYDIIEFTDFCSPIICGHNTRSLKHLYKTQIGDTITLINDSIEVQYEVFISEKVILSEDSFDLLSIEDGHSMFLEYQNDPTILRIYTCHGISKQSRWLVCARKISADT